MNHIPVPVYETRYIQVPELNFEHPFSQRQCMYLYTSMVMVQQLAPIIKYRTGIGTYCSILYIQRYLVPGSYLVPP